MFRSTACWDPPTSKETGYTASITNTETTGLYSALSKTQSISLARVAELNTLSVSLTRVAELNTRSVSMTRVAELNTRSVSLTRVAELNTHSVSLARVAELNITDKHIYKIPTNIHKKASSSGFGFN